MIIIGYFIGFIIGLELVYLFYYLYKKHSYEQTYKIRQKDLDKAWGLFIKNTINFSNKSKDKFIQLRDKLQKEINKKGYANINNPELKEWWLKNEL